MPMGYYGLHELQGNASFHSIRGEERIHLLNTVYRLLSTDRTEGTRVTSFINQNNLLLSGEVQLKTMSICAAYTGPKPSWV